MILLVSVMDFCVRSANFLTSSATTANPLPYSPALAASIAAFNASRFVCSVISVIATSTPCIFLASFANNNILRPGCSNCEFAGVNDLADMSIGDFWGIEKVMPKYSKKQKNGISIIRINTNKGNSLFEDICRNLEYYESNLKDGYRENHKYAVQLNGNRFDLMEQIDGVEINSLLESFNQFKSGKNANKKIKEKGI